MRIEKVPSVRLLMIMLCLVCGSLYLEWVVLVYAFGLFEPQIHGHFDLIYSVLPVVSLVLFVGWIKFRFEGSS